VSSLRIGDLDSGLLGLLHRCGVNSLTVAPESASPSLLKAIGKGYDPEQLGELVRLASREGFSALKLYYMAGLPGETAADRELLASQLAELSAAAGGALKLKVSINPFIPKPQTAWQDCPMLPQGEIKRLFKSLKQQVTRAAPGVELSWQSPAEAAAQAVLSLGGRELAPAIEKSARERVRLLDCLKESGVDVEKMLYQREKPAAGHPWKVLECEPSIQT
jgi:radical SAM superfamily enzyme YgiQ (UPF0313 family)